MNTIVFVVAALSAALTTIGPASNAFVAHSQNSDFAGQWQYKVDDGTYWEDIELTVRGDQVRGTLDAYERGYFSGRTTSAASLRVEGTVRSGRVVARLIDASIGVARDVEISRRGSYLVLRGAGRTTGYARPGTSLVQDADGSSEAATLARTITGRVYQTASQTSGRGSLVGGRIRLALCANGEIAYDESELATVPGSSAGATNDMGRTMSRRGEWTVVLYAGAPAVMARWHGTGSSYSLTAYFDIQPSVDGQSIVLDGKRLPMTGRC